MAVLLGLSVEILVLVIVKLDVWSIVACRSCCRLLKSVIENSVAIQYQIELAASGYEDKHSTQDEHLSIATRREILKRHRNAWNTLDWVESRVSGEMDDHTNTLSDTHISGGMYATPGDDDHSIIFYELPSLAGDIPARQWTHADVGVSFVEFSFDRGLDLLLLIEQFELLTSGFTPRVHVRSLSDLSVYPAAKRPFIDFPSRLEVNNHPYRTQIEGDIYGVWFESDWIVAPSDDGEVLSGTIVLWNYIEGTLLGTLGDTGKENITSFTMIDSKTILITQTSTHKLRPMIASVNIYRIGMAPENLTLIASFRLPALTADVAKSRILIVSALPPPANIAASPRAEKDTAPYFPFRIAQTNRMIAMRWVIEDPLLRTIADLGFKYGLDEAEPAVFRIFVHLRTFIDRIPSGNTPVIWEWNDWGPHNTRILPESLANLDNDDPPSEWQTHGGRLISHTQPLDSRWKSTYIPMFKTIMVLDFNDYAPRFWKCTDVDLAIRLFHTQGFEGKPRDTLSYIVPRNKPTVIDQTFFADQVVSTSLPYCVAMRYYNPGWEYEVDNICCDDEHIICKLSDLRDDHPSQLSIFTME